MKLACKEKSVKVTTPHGPGDAIESNSGVQEKNAEIYINKKGHVAPAETFRIRAKRNHSEKLIPQSEHK